MSAADFDSWSGFVAEAMLASEFHILMHNKREEHVEGRHVLNPVTSFLRENDGSLSRWKPWYLTCIVWELRDSLAAFSFIEGVAHIQMVFVKVVPCQGIWGMARYMQELNPKRDAREGEEFHWISGQSAFSLFTVF
jgi:hypothetical protein